MWQNTRLTRLLGIELPIVSSPMAGGPSTSALAAAVSDAGGLGSLGLGYSTPDDIRAAIRATRALTDAAFQINLFVPPPEPPLLDAAAVGQVEEMVAELRSDLGLPVRLPVPERLSVPFADQTAVLIEERVPVAGFAFGVPPADTVAALRENGTVVFATATSVAEARALVAAGVQVVTAQGAEAGGHRGQFVGGDGSGPREEGTPVGDPIGTMALVPAVVDALGADVPVVAAGGLRDGRSVLAVLALGADAAQLGTAFLRTPEAGTNEPYRAALAAADGSETVLTTAFSGKPARGLRNAYVDAVGVRPDVPPYPVTHVLTTELRAAARAAGRSDLQSLWAGQGVAGARDLPAGRLLGLWVDEIEAILEDWRS
ncbi:NAD(P)H-dependent flavin oxidoreductase [Sporichthya polymorpha]|uniref:NAD(P)H-dependent flavin oxidoreductase n=1 Tax=Sporichthya polymorpha TaxID=35751 RepID=UPI00036D7740|nr:nitronate monooxygenase family protein [Sporichthya polymorpha]